MANKSKLSLFLLVVDGLGLAAAVWAIHTSHFDIPAHARLLVLVTAALVFIGEFCPIRLWRQESVNEYTFSGTFSLALVATGPFIFVVCAQLTALLISEIHKRKPPKVVAFNLSQYLLTLTAARLTFCATSGVDFGSFDDPTPTTSLLALAAAALSFFLINAVLTGTVLSLVGSHPLRRFVLKYLRDECPVTPIVLALSPVVLACMAFSPLTVPLTFLLIMALRRASAVAAEHEIASQHDALTGLPNRSLLLIRLNHAMKEAEQRSGHVALMMLDLDHFKEINDTLGHHIGDELLRMVSERLSAAVRDRDTVARLGGDEFAIVLPGADAPEAAVIAQRLAQILSEPFRLVNVSLNVEASVGVAVHPQHGADAETLTRLADVALYTAKENRGTFVIYDPGSDQHTVERLALMGELRRGIENGELVVYYQPKVSTDDLRLVSVEALVRWNHPELGLLPPGRFIPAAENTGLILPLTDRVLRDSLSAVRAWRSHGLDVSVSVNVTARHIANMELPTQVIAALAEAGLPGSALTLEVTESCLMSDPGRAREVLRRLAVAGVGLSIDDFGTGYSSFSNLRDLAVNEIKIDRSFVSQMDVSPADAAIVKSAIDLGHNLDLNVVAEGVETQECMDRLTDMGCDVVQGYLLGRPMTADQVLSWSRSHVGIRRAELAC